MDSRWGSEFTAARQRLLESNDFRALVNDGHELKDGVVLTSVSDLPFEMSFKCIDCGETFWFENAAWSTGEPPQWRLNSHSGQAAGGLCHPLTVGHAGMGPRRIGLRF